MSVITRLARAKRQDNKINVYLDGKYSLSLPNDVVVREGLHKDQELSDAHLKSLVETGRQRRCLDAATRYIGYRPRSELEVRQRLQRRGFDGDSIEKAVSSLKEQGYIDDDSFARFWKENRQDFSPRSRRLTRMELQRKGVDNELIERIVSELDDSESAYRAALKKVRQLPLADYPLFRRRLGDHLRRKGFGYEVIKETVTRVWREHGAEPV
jgi:regulatory protein